MAERLTFTTAASYEKSRSGTRKYELVDSVFLKGFGKILTFSGKELKDIIQNTSYAASRDDLKPVLQGVLFKIEKDGIISVATDGHRLVKLEKNKTKRLR